MTFDLTLTLFLSLEAIFVCLYNSNYYQEKLCLWNKWI